MWEYHSQQLQGVVSFHTVVEDIQVDIEMVDEE